MTIAGPASLNFRMPETATSFREPSDIQVYLDDDPLLYDLVATSAFQRLKEIRFLGAIDYRRVPRPNGKPRSTRYTRYQHSLGVMRLARLYCTQRELPLTDTRLVCVAALLHDVGHPPLSHSMEPVFKERFGIDHHGATESIISGHGILGKDVFSTLRYHRINIERLISVISGESSEFDGFFDGPINFDTIEGVLRSCAYLRQASTIPSPDTVTEAAIRRESKDDRDMVDAFWKQKNWVYKNIINSQDGVLSDYACRFFLRRNIGRIGRDSFFATEAEIFRRTPGLRKLLTSTTFEQEMVQMIDEPVYYRERHYFVDRRGDFFARCDDIRYRNERSDRVLALDTVPNLDVTEKEKGRQGAFFDDNTI